MEWNGFCWNSKEFQHSSWNPLELMGESKDLWEVSSAWTGRGQMVVPQPLTTPVTSAPDAESRLMGLRAVLEQRLDPSPPYKPDAWCEYLLAAGLLDKYPGIPDGLHLGFDAGIRPISQTFAPSIIYLLQSILLNIIPLFKLSSKRSVTWALSGKWSFLSGPSRLPHLVSYQNQGDLGNSASFKTFLCFIPPLIPSLPSTARLTQVSTPALGVLFQSFASSYGTSPRLASCSTQCQGSVQGPPYQAPAVAWPGCSSGQR